MTKKPVLIIVLAALISGAYSNMAQAQSCTPHVTNIDFGEIDVTANVPFSTTGQYTISCSSFVGVSAIRTCPNIGVGAGGGLPSGQRYLVSGTNFLSFNLFSDPGHATIWGSRYWAGTVPTIDIPLHVTALGLIQIGTNSTSQPIHAFIPAGQQTLPPGTYVSSFLGNQTAINHGGYLLDLPLLAPSCASLSSPNLRAPFTVSATVVPKCTVAANNLDFGSVGVLTAALNSSNNLTVTCTATTPYNVSLSVGAGNNPSQRTMTRGGEHVVYGLYRDPARTQQWGEAIGINTLADVGTGMPQAHTVYGRVPAQTMPSPGAYTDTVIATIVY